jgi:hypothetical protein
VTHKGAKAKEDDAASPKPQNITAKPQGRQKVGIGAAIGGWANDGAEDAARTSKGQGKPAGGNKIGAKGSPTPRPR